MNVPIKCRLLGDSGSQRWVLERYGSLGIVKGSHSLVRLGQRFAMKQGLLREVSRCRLPKSFKSTILEVWKVTWSANVLFQQRKQLKKSNKSQESVHEAGHHLPKV